MKKEELLGLKLSDVGVLTDLGLTLIQAKAYLSLIEFGPLSISNISKASKVPRPDLYRILHNLQEIGLVEKIITAPIEYKAIPIKEGLSLLLGAKTKQYKKVRAETQILLTEAETKPKKKRIEPTQFALIPEKAVISIIRDAIEETQANMDLVLSWSMFSRAIVDVFAESLEIAWAKKVKIRCITECPLESKLTKQLTQFFNEKPFCRITFVRNYPKAIVGIFDKKKAFIAVNPRERCLIDSPILWSENFSIVTLGEAYFELLLLKAIKESSRPNKLATMNVDGIDLDL